MTYSAPFGSAELFTAFRELDPYLAVNSSNVSSLSSDPDVLGAEVLKVHAGAGDWELRTLNLEAVRAKGGRGRRRGEERERARSRLVEAM